MPGVLVRFRAFPLPSHFRGWVPEETFATGLRKTVQWYLDHLEWCQRVQDGSYQGQRLGFTEPRDLIA